MINVLEKVSSYVETRNVSAQNIDPVLLIPDFGVLFPPPLLVAGQKYAILNYIFALKVLISLILYWDFV